MKGVHFFQKYYKMSSSDPRLKKLRIKTGVVKRGGKEKLSYRKEANLQKVLVRLFEVNMQLVKLR